MTDHCLFFHDLLDVLDGRAKTYAVHEPPNTGLVCLDLRLRRGADWCFARKWLSVRNGPRELYRTLDRLEGRGFRFEVSATRPLPPTSQAPGQDWNQSTLRAQQLHAGLSEEERRIHEELFPEEAALIARGYDWDAKDVYVRGEPLRADAYGRLLESEADVLFEWVRVEDEFTWRRYPLERLRISVTAPGR